MTANSEVTVKTKRENPYAFKPGQSGNPSGRPKKSEEQRTLEAMCREKTTEALATILAIMSEGENERNKLAAAQYVIDRGWGKPVQSTELTGKDGAPIDHSITVTFVKKSIIKE